MDRLDEFAGRALQALIARASSGCSDEHLAKLSYNVAAAMVAESERRHAANKPASVPEPQHGTCRTCGDQIVVPYGDTMICDECAEHIRATDPTAIGVPG